MTTNVTARTYTAISTTGYRWDVLGFGSTKAEAEAMAEAAIVALVGESGIYAETYRKNLRVVGRTTALVPHARSVRLGRQQLGPG